MSNGVLPEGGSESLTWSGVRKGLQGPKEKKSLNSGRQEKSKKGIGSRGETRRKCLGRRGEECGERFQTREELEVVVFISTGPGKKGKLSLNGYRAVRAKQFFGEVKGGMGRHTNSTVMSVQGIVGVA